MHPRSAIIPQPRCAVKVRAAGTNDLAFIDQLQKLHTHMVGFFPRKQMEGYLAMGAVQVAESDEATKARSDEGSEAESESGPSVAPSLLPSATSSRAMNIRGAMMWGSSTRSTSYP